jgi:acyl carrier protein
MAIGDVLLHAIIAVLIVAAVWSVWNESRAKKRKIKEAFAGRKSLTPEEFYERHFLDLGVAPEIVVGIRRILEEQLDADMSCLRSEDDFSQNLGFFWYFDSMADVELIMAIEAHFQIKITDAEAEKTHTVSELVQLVSEKVGQTSVS